MTILTRTQGAKYLTISDATFHRLVKAGKIPVYRPSEGVTRFLKSDLDTYLINTRQNND